MTTDGTDKEKTIKSQHTKAFSLGAKCHINLSRLNSITAYIIILYFLGKCLIGFKIFKYSSGKSKLCS